MRVIAGTARSIPLIAPAGNNTRPTTDKIKETLFNILQFDLQGAVFIDIFAGSGAIGIEALSRGAKQAVFVDSGRDAINCITANVRKCHFEDRSIIVKGDASAFASYASRASLKDADKLIVFMDPPYEKDMELPVLKAIHESGLLKKDSIVIVEEALKYELKLPDEYGFEIFRTKEYKNQKHMFLKVL